MQNKDDIFGRPFGKLGNRLKAVREKRKESLTEVSGAVEIDPETLKQIEQGEQRPSEEVLLLLMSHLEIQDDEATSLWELAAYDEGSNAHGAIHDNGEQIKQFAFAMPMDLRIVYTDMVNVTANNYGVVMNFMQNGGSGNPPLAISRIGMSREHAKSVLEVLKTTLEQVEKSTQPKVLPEFTRPTDKTDTQN